MPRHHPRRRRLARLAAGVTALVAVGVGAAMLTVPSLVATPAAATGSEPAGRRGELLAVTPVAELDTGQVATYLEEIKLDTARVRSGVQAYQVVYGTVDPHGEPTTASGLVALPRDGQPDVQLVSWLHGTTVDRGEAASLNADGLDRHAAFAFASAGYAVAAPDYLGLGLGPGRHPYIDTDSSVTASVDMLRAARALAEREGRRVDERVLVTGHSQGGMNTLALGQALQEGTDHGFRLGALAPIAGPFDVFEVVRLGAANGISNATAYLTYLTVSADRLHDIYDTPGEVFRAPYDRTVETLFDNNHATEEVFAGLARTPQEMFTPEYLERLRNPTGGLRRMLDEAQVCEWRPQVPVHLYASSGDRDVPIGNSRFCRDELRAQGAEVTLTDAGNVDHNTTAILSLPKVLEQFAEPAA